MEKLKHLKQAVILAGGRGKRLSPLTDKMPKPMVLVNGIPFLDYLISSIFQAGIKRILILTGYKGENIVERYRKLLNEEIEIDYSIGAAEDQTGRRLLNAYGLLDDYFLLLYGDNYWPMELNKMLDLYNQRNVKMLTTVFSNRKGTGEYGQENNIRVRKDKFVEVYDKSRKSADLNGVDIGYFIVNKDAIAPNPVGNISFEEYLLPRLVSERQLIAYVTDTQYYYITDINSLKDFEAVVIEKDIKPMPKSYFKGR